jgi:hypothetical protein
MASWLGSAVVPLFNPMKNWQMFSQTFPSYNFVGPVSHSDALNVMEGIDELPLTLIRCGQIPLFIWPSLGILVSVVIVFLPRDGSK